MKLDAVVLSDEVPVQDKHSLLLFGGGKPRISRIVVNVIVADPTSDVVVVLEFDLLQWSSFGPELFAKPAFEELVAASTVAQDLGRRPAGAQSRSLRRALYGTIYLAGTSSILSANSQGTKSLHREMKCHGLLPIQTRLTHSKQPVISRQSAIGYPFQSRRDRLHPADSPSSPSKFR
jgi:hypothetical protein